MNMSELQDIHNRGEYSMTTRFVLLWQLATGVAVTRKGTQEEDTPCSPLQMAAVSRYVTVWGYITFEVPLLGN